MWKTVQLGDLCEILDTRRKPITKKDRIHGEYPYYGATGIVDWVADYIFDEELVLIGEDGAKWDAGEKTAFIVNGKYWVNNHAHVVKPNTEKLLNKWLTYYLCGIDLKPWVTGMTVPKLNQGQLKSIPIPLPPLAEQERIVAKLDAAFAEIDEAVSKEKLKEMENEKLKAKILSNFLHHKDWDKFKFDEICLIKNGGTPKTKIESYWGGDIKWLTPKDMGKINGKFVNDSGRKISNDGLKNSSAKLIPSESLILSCRAPIGHVFINKIEMSFNQGCKGLVTNDKVNVEYLYYFLLSSKKLLNDLGTGTTFKEISSKVLGNVEIALPALHKQEEIIVKLNAAFLEIENIKQFIESKKQNYAVLKAAILSQELQSSEAA